VHLHTLINAGNKDLILYIDACLSMFGFRFSFRWRFSYPWVALWFCS